jgi:hypothetical protein
MAVATIRPLTLNARTIFLDKDVAGWQDEKCFGAAARIGIAISQLEAGPLSVTSEEELLYKTASLPYDCLQRLSSLCRRHGRNLRRILYQTR